MKKLLPAIILLCSFCCHAQNYQCLQAGVKHYFINGNGYLRGIRIDSVRTMGDTIVYYPFHTPRGAYDVMGGIPLLDTNGGSWLGKKVLQKADGTYLFDSYWNDSVIIKTQSNIGDSWTFYKDTSNLYYQASLTAIDTMTVLGTLDSVKTILITAHNPTGIVTTDPVNNFNIILSKNNGFVQVFDLYTFPYHKPDSAYQPGLDYFLDRSSIDYNYINWEHGNTPSAFISEFRLVDFVNPNEQQLHNWNIGDIIETYHHFANFAGIYAFCFPEVQYFDRISDTVSDKTTSGHAITYTVTGHHYSCSYPLDPCVLILNSGLYTFYDDAYPFFDSSYIPEQQMPTLYLFYFPYDSNYCSASPAYVSLRAEYAGNGGLMSPTPKFYKLGIGLTSYDEGSLADCILEYEGMGYTNINGIACGIPSSTNSVNLPSTEIQLFPNPTTTELTITSPDKITQLTITNIFGQITYTHDYNTAKAQIDVTNLPPGIYFVKINGSEVRKFVKQ